jgi:hypothetical protein
MNDKVLEGKGEFAITEISRNVFQFPGNPFFFVEVEVTRLTVGQSAYPSWCRAVLWGP